MKYTDIINKNGSDIFLVISKNKGEQLNFNVADKIINLMSNDNIQRFMIMSTDVTDDPLNQDIGGIIMLTHMVNYIHDLGKEVIISTLFNIEEVNEEREKAIKEVWRNIDDEKRLAIARYNLLSQCDKIIS